MVTQINKLFTKHKIIIIHIKNVVDGGVGKRKAKGRKEVGYMGCGKCILMKGMDVGYFMSYSHALKAL